MNDEMKIESNLKMFINKNKDPKVEFNWSKEV